MPVVKSCCVAEQALYFTEYGGSSAWLHLAGKPLAAATFEAGACSLHLRHLAESKIPHEIVKDTDDERYVCEGTPR